MGSGDPSPVDLPGASPAVLAIHGFGATPAETALIVETARAAGLRVKAPLLPGHGTHATDLARRKFGEWKAAALDAFDEITADGSRAIVVGQSLGGVLALHVAQERPGAVAGLGLLATAIRLTKLTTELPLRLIDRAKVPDFTLPKANGADIKDLSARETQLTYGTQPIHAAVEVMRGGMQAEARLGEILSPVFIAHGRGDHVCPVGNAQVIYEHVGSTDKTVLILENSYHIITRDNDRALLGRELARFVKRISRGTESPWP
jgi:carboxylesterase